MSDPPDRRKSRRTSELKPTFIMLKGYNFRVHDISNDGIGLILEPGAPQFVLGQRFDQIPIPMQSGTVHLRGIVTHISITAAHTVCGINFLFSGDEYKSILQFKKERCEPPSDG